MPAFRTADREANDLIPALIDEFCSDLKEAGVRVGCRFAFPTGHAIHALKHQGWPAAALVRIVQQKDRVSGMPDAMIDVDGAAWLDWDEDRRRATLHHELHHLLVVRDRKTGRIKTDDCHRPKLRLRPHDFQLGGFFTIIDRYGISAIEASAATDLHRKLVQREFVFA